MIRISYFKVEYDSISVYFIFCFILIFIHFLEFYRFTVNSRYLLIIIHEGIAVIILSLHYHIIVNYVIEI